MEDTEMLTVQVQSADEAVVEDVENTAEVTILDVSIGKVGMKLVTESSKPIPRKGCLYIHWTARDYWTDLLT